VSARPSEQRLATASWVESVGAFLAPLALAQFICSFAGSNMNVMIEPISHDLHTDVKGVQTTITLFLVIMAVLMIPCSKLTDRWGRKRCFIGGLGLYGIGAVLSAIAPGLGVLILGNSVFEGVGTAFLIRVRVAWRDDRALIYGGTPASWLLHWVRFERVIRRGCGAGAESRGC